jgi:hypothetical protein
MTIRLSRGSVTSTFLRLCSRAPRTTIDLCASRFCACFGMKNPGIAEREAGRRRAAASGP